MRSYIGTKVKFAIIPALIFWAVSMVFFVMGLSFDDTSGWMIWIAGALAIANTIVQFIGNDLGDEMDGVTKAGWYSSYILGIGSNTYALSIILNIPNTWVEWAICISLGSMIEILPERLMVLFLRGVYPHLSLRSNGDLADWESGPTTTRRQVATAPRPVTNTRGNPYPSSLPRSGSAVRTPYEGPIVAAGPNKPVIKQRPHIVSQDVVMSDLDPTWHPVSYDAKSHD